MKHHVWKAVFAVPLGACIINGGSEAEPAQLDVGVPEAISFVETDVGGAVRHELCVAADQPTGYIVPIQLVDQGSIGPVSGAPLQATPIEDLDCPGEAQWQGWTRLQWDTTTGRALLSIEHSATRGVGDEGDGELEPPDAGFEFEPRHFASGGQTLIEGVAFEGYAITAGDLEQVGATTWSLPLHVDYRETGTLTATPASNVTVVMVWQPFLDPSLIVGGSPGIDIEAGTIATDVDGDAYVLVSDQALCFDYVLFATTPDGGTDLVTTLGCPI